MLRKDNFVWGVLAGILLPGLALIYQKTTSNNLGISQHHQIIYLIGIALNLIIVRMAYRKDLEKTGRGLMFITFLAAMVLFYFKRQS